MSKINSQSLLQKAFIESLVDKLPPSKAITIPSSSSCKHAIEAMKHEKIGCVLICEGEDLKGIFTERDVLQKLTQRKVNLDSIKVSEVMTHRPQHLNYNASVAKAMYLMHVGGFRHIPIKSKNGSWSMISVVDFIRFIHEKVKARAELQASREDYIIDPNAVDLFLEGNISALKPTKPLILEPDTPCEEVVAKMSSQRVGSAVLGDTKKLSVDGIFTERDLIKRYILEREDLRLRPISEIMTQSPTTIQPSISVMYALDAMTTGHFRHIPVVDIHEKLTGVLSVKDFMSYLSESIVEELNKAQKK